MGGGMARQCSRNRCLAGWTVWIPPSWPRRRSRSSELEERPPHGPNPSFCALRGFKRGAVEICFDHSGDGFIQRAILARGDCRILCGNTDLPCVLGHFIANSQREKEIADFRSREALEPPLAVIGKTSEESDIASIATVSAENAAAGLILCVISKMRLVQEVPPAFDMTCQRISPPRGCAFGPEKAQDHLVLS